LSFLAGFFIPLQNPAHTTAGLACVMTALVVFFVMALGGLFHREYIASKKSPATIIVQIDDEGIEV